MIAREGPLEPVRAVRVVAQVADALDATHALGLVHRDVKPQKRAPGRRWTALLSDFGLTKHMAENTRLTDPGSVLGSFDYTAPEQLDDGPVDARADVYALGCVLYEAVTGSVPYPRESVAAKLFAHASAPPPAV